MARDKTLQGRPLSPLSPRGFRIPLELGRGRNGVALPSIGRTVSSNDNNLNPIHKRLPILNPFVSTKLRLSSLVFGMIPSYEF